MSGLKRPCVNCPFLKVGGIRLRPDRAREIARYFTDMQGGTFPCHKTVMHGDDDDDDEGGRPMRDGEELCAGGILYADKQGKANQIVRIFERIGVIDLRSMTGAELVFDSERAMVAASRKP